MRSHPQPPSFRQRTGSGHRRLLAAVLALLLVGMALAAGEGGGSAVRAVAPPGKVVLHAGGRRLAEFSLRPYLAHGRLNTPRLAAEIRRRLPDMMTVRSGQARIVYRLDRSAAIRQAVRIDRHGGTITVSRRALSATVVAPVIGQKLHNNCESAALQILLATVSVRVDQLRLQAEMPRSGSLDPLGAAPDQLWGDPDLGFVGRSDGGGAAGGFGVYPGPVAQVARRHGRQLENVTGASVAAIYARLLRGRAVMAWVGLRAGPYGQWRTPAGRSIRVNFNEHTVVLNGVRPDGALQVVNPLQGTREVWSRRQFEAMWSVLGRRALST